jgi:thiol-disulfide isomerase/thioredoxin
MAVAALGDRLLVTELLGDAVVLDTAGRFVREWLGPHAVTLYAAAGARVIAARSPYRVPQFLAESASAPLFVVLDSTGIPLERIATIRSPDPPVLAQVANAGAVAADGDSAIYYAPLTRDEIVRYDAGGAVRWTARRGVGPLPVVNVALAVGPDGRLYALGAADSAVARFRLDVFDAATGRLVSSRPLEPAESGVAVDRRGTVRLFDAGAAIAAAQPAERERFEPPFALPDLAGDTVHLARFAGRVTLVNFWASWCDPCREEFPHMADLTRSIDSSDFAVVAISDDVDDRAMRAFVTEFDPPFVVLAGGGRMKGIYHYRGLPYSVLLDRQGRVVERIFGFGGAAEFQRLRATIAKEIGGA